MRTAGFPCRVLDCGQVFQVVDQRSMDALKAASAARTAHETAAHEYHHVSVATEPSYSPYQRSSVRPAAAPTRPTRSSR